MISQHPLVYFFLSCSFAYLSYFSRFFSKFYFESSWFFIAFSCCSRRFCLLQNYCIAWEDILDYFWFYLLAYYSPKVIRIGFKVVRNYEIISPLVSPIALELYNFTNSSISFVRFFFFPLYAPDSNFFINGIDKSFNSSTFLTSVNCLFTSIIFFSFALRQFFNFV